MTLSEMLVEAIKAKGFVELKEAAKVMGVKYETLRKTVNEGHVPKDSVLLEYAKKLGINRNELIMKSHQQRAPEEMRGLFELAPPQYPNLRTLMVDRCAKDRGRVLSEFYSAPLSCLEALAYEAVARWVAALHKMAADAPEPLLGLGRALQAASTTHERFSALEAHHQVLSRLLRDWRFEPQTGRIHIRFAAQEEPFLSQITLTYQKSVLGPVPRRESSPDFSRDARLEGKPDRPFFEGLGLSARPWSSGTNSLPPGLQALVDSGDGGKLADEEIEWLRQVTPSNGQRDKQFYAFALSLLRNSTLMARPTGSAA